MPEISTTPAHFPRIFALAAYGALQGFLWGTLLAITLAVLVVLIPPIESLATDLRSSATAHHCSPWPDHPGGLRWTDPTIFLAAMYAFRKTMVELSPAYDPPTKRASTWSPHTAVGACRSRQSTAA